MWWRIKASRNPWQDLQKSLTDTAVQAASGVDIGRFLLTTLKSSANPTLERRFERGVFEDIEVRRVDLITLNP